MKTEPTLQPAEDQVVDSTYGDNVRPIITAWDIWQTGQNAFFSVRVTNTNYVWQCFLKTEKVLKTHEKEKEKK